MHLIQASEAELRKWLTQAKFKPQKELFPAGCTAMYILIHPSKTDSYLTKIVRYL